MSSPEEELHLRNYGTSSQPQVSGLRGSVWNQDNLRLKYRKLDKDISADVVVVGAGIAGLSVAYNLTKHGKSVVVHPRWRADREDNSSYHAVV